MTNKLTKNQKRRNKKRELKKILASEPVSIKELPKQPVRVIVMFRAMI